MALVVVPTVQTSAVDDALAPAVAALAQGFPKSHAQRLRQYFQSVMRGGASAPADTIDLDLDVHGLIARVPPNGFSSSVLYAITPKGSLLLATLRDQTRAARAPHHALAHDLAQWLETNRRWAWEDPVLGDARPDVFSLASTFVTGKMAPMVHEVKVSRADFLADVRVPAKRAAYFRWAPQVFYATPEGLIEPHEVPEECGWVERTAPEVWRLRKKAPKQAGGVRWDDGMWAQLVARTRTAQGL